jgi:hypothetical protein
LRSVEAPEKHEGKKPYAKASRKDTNFL